VQKQYGRVYIKKMFITENCEEILPDWAFFTRIIINSESLSPTASREGIYLDSNAIELKEDIENSLRSYFIELGKTAPKVLTDIIQSHNAAIKQMALENLDFLKLIYPWIPFPTSQGQLTLEEALKRTKTIYHVPDVDEYRQVLPIANANDQLIVNSGYIYDAELLDVIDSIDIKTNYIKVDAAYFGNTLEDLSLDEHDAHAKRLEALGEHLSKFGCRLDIKKFKPDSIPALYHANQNLMFSRDVKSIQEQSGDLWGEVSRSVYNAKSEQKSTLFLNFENKTIQSLLMNDKPDLDMTIIQVIYTNAMLMGHYPLSKEELQSVDSNLHGLIEVALQKNK
ncbi:MAG: hypothetical protein MRY83_08135, partial [Flavobacteriales bacterium]|nr:hypothetical protein [Flavobacteriales bacterium]